MEKPFLSIDEVARRFNVSVSTVRRWIRAGKLKGQKAGAQWRFDPIAIQGAFEAGEFSGVAPAFPISTMGDQRAESPEWAKPLLAKWARSVKDHIAKEEPEHVIVNDRRGAKIWALMMPGDYTWGHNLWHSTAISVMDPAEAKRIFGQRKVLLFDEMMQRGREMFELRQQLTAKEVGASVTSIVCVRRRALFESGELLEPRAIACEDVGDDLFTERAAFISRLVHIFEPPLDVDHLVIRGNLALGLSIDRFLEKLSNWGTPFIVWVPDREHAFMAVTLDRPRFINTGDFAKSAGFSVRWTGPCKIRFYIDLTSGTCYCSFIAYPALEASDSTWQSALDSKRIRGRVKKGDEELQISQEGVIESERRRFYLNVCMNSAIKLLNDFVFYGVAEDIGVVLRASSDSVDSNQLRATFGRTTGDEIAKRTRHIIAKGSHGRGLFQASFENPPLAAVRGESTSSETAYDLFDCRTKLLKTIQHYGDIPDERVQPISYPELLDSLSEYSESTIGRVLDYELDRGTIKPVTRTDFEGKGDTDIVGLQRAFYRGEFGVWFEWDQRVLTHEDRAIQRTIGLGPTVIEQFLTRSGGSQMTATHFDKIFTNLQHDLRENVHDVFYLGWRPYKFGPVPVAPVKSPSGEYKRFERFLLESGSIKELKERHGTQTWLRYTPADESKVPWREAYRRGTSAVTRAHVNALVRLYVAIQKECETVRPQRPRSATVSALQDPLVVLAAARNEEIAYICGWFEVCDWLRQGELVFPLLKTIAIAGKRAESPYMTERMEQFAAPARLLFDKVEMYRNLPHLRKQIETLLLRDEFDVGEVLMETVDAVPRFEEQSAYPVQNLSWCCTVMRAFSSMTRQLLTACGLDVDKREKNAEGEPSRDASFYLNELLDNCPEVEVLADSLRSCIALSGSGLLEDRIADCLSKAFSLIKEILEGQGRLPDPRPQYERDRDHLQYRDGIITRIQELYVPDPYAIAVADIRNLKNLPRYGDIFGVSYDEALDHLLAWAHREAKGALKLHPSVRLGGFPADNIIFAGQNAEEVVAAAKDMIRGTYKHLKAIDANLFAPFGLLRIGIAWRQQEKGESFAGSQPGFIAHSIGDKTGRSLGTIAITEAIYDILSGSHRDEFAESNEATGQGRVYLRPWNSERDSL